jgi:hypothetical protein
MVDAIFVMVVTTRALIAAETNVVATVLHPLVFSPLSGSLA